MFIRQRLTMVILNGIMVYSVALFFLLMRLQISVNSISSETITTILFIVSFSGLPNIARTTANMKKKQSKLSYHFIMVGAVVTLIFIAQQGDGLESISKYYTNTYELTGGKIL